jgi:hypothetical protein
VSNKDVSSFGREAELFPKSSGETALNEDQIPQGQEWNYNSDHSLNVLMPKPGYVTGIYNGALSIDNDLTLDATVNHMSIGTVTISDGVTVTLEGEWVII